MIKFHYKAKEGPHRIINGVIEADNLNNAISKIVGLKLTPLDVVPESEVQQQSAAKAPSKSSFKFFRRVGPRDVVVFSRQISDLVDASVPILRALGTISHQTQNPYFQEIILQMHNAVKDGGSFSDALSQHPQIFSGIYVNMVKAGEVSGRLEIILIRLADYLEKEEETKGKVKSSLAYPLLILIVGIITIFVLLTFVIPRLSVMFEDFNQSLPLPTIILVNLSNFFAAFWWLILAIVGIGWMYLKQTLKTTRGRRQYDEFILKIPYIGSFIKVTEISRISRTLGTLLESGVTITTALKSVTAVAQNVILQEQLKQVSDDVANGASLAIALKQSTFFPEMAVNMISIGEETGKLERGLHKIADTYEQQSNQATKVMVDLVGPLVLVVIVGIVGFVVVAMLLPIFQMNLIIQ